MTVHREVLERQTTPGTDIHDLTADVERVVAESGVSEGQVLVFAPGSTAGITTIEFEPGAVADLERAVERRMPRDIHYDHDARWGDGNGFSHVRAAMMGPSLTLPVIDGKPEHGTWQQVILCDFDNKRRTRRIVVQVLGEASTEK